MSEHPLRARFERHTGPLDHFVVHAPTHRLGSHGIGMGRVVDGQRVSLGLKLLDMSDASVREAGARAAKFWLSRAS